MKRDVKENIYEKLAHKYRMSLEQAKANCRNVAQMASEVGLDFQFDTMILTNTFDAHRLAMFAKKQGLMREMTERILRAHYTESRHIGDLSTLVQLAEEVGLDHDAVKDMLASTNLSDEVRADEREAQHLGIQSIPYFLINRKYAISGAQPTDAFVNAINQIIEQDGPFTNVNSQTGASCDEDGCEIPEK